MEVLTAGPDVLSGLVVRLIPQIIHLKVYQFLILRFNRGGKKLLVLVTFTAKSNKMRLCFLTFWGGGTNMAG